ncbi:DUF1611 domain-containing protein [Algoriphagus kandeliae]|uniref:DUF1611 domain-containing protein n=1 Tax=Algoriphagus kandeliae TaxID=2562278 RepID=A0A4Y9QKE0_9BACT|nr:DUF1611 domain-containing protein [Algoriphagus kandeliae]TFV93171.1 DUF1611 domain-containing protein [Algoriphagus kandeliae]
MNTRIKKGMLCNKIDPARLLSPELLPLDTSFQAGDVGVFEVLEIGKHTQLQSSGRNLSILPGDHIMCVFGTRYATNQFEGYIPSQIQDEYHLLGGGGVVGILESTHVKYEKEGPTRLKLIGMAVDHKGQIINTILERKNAIKKFTGKEAHKTKVILSLGSSMDSGKTTTAAYLVHGFAKKGITSAYIKLTGTAYPKDKNLAYDLGAAVSVDFSKFGYPSTYLSSEAEILNLYETLLTEVNTLNPEFVVVEIADGLFQRETRMLLQNPVFMSTVHQVVFSAGDSLSAVHGMETLINWEIMPSALSGLFTASPLLIKEVKEYLYEKQDLLFMPILNLEDLSLGKWPMIHQSSNLLQA